MTALAETLELDSDNPAPGLLGLAERGLMPETADHIARQSRRVPR